jgi:hypothetical protein
MDFVEKYYVGFQKERYSKTDDQRMLGFATPIDNTAAYRKRKETVDGWRDKNIATIELENKPRYGFQIVDTVTRYRTNNKLFRVLDPAGFELEISAENLFHIIASCTIAKGTIADPMVWARGPSKNYLISSNSEEYKMYLQPKKSANHVPGAWMKHKTGNVFYRYEGRFSYIILGYDVDRKDPLGGRYYGYYNRTQDFSKVETDVKFTVNRKNDKTATVYTEWSLDEDGNLKRNPVTIHIRKSYFKDLVELDEKDPKTPEYDLSVGKVIGNKDDLRVTTMMGNAWRNNYILFNTKEEAFAEKFDVERMNSILKPIETYNSYYKEDYYGKVAYSIHDIR